MRRLTVAALAGALVMALVPAARSGPETLMLVRVPVERRADAAFLLSNFDETHNHSRRAVELLLWPGDRARLERAGYRYEVLVEDLVAHEAGSTAAAAPVALPGPDRSDYRVLADYEAEMRALAEDNPGLVRLFEMKRPSLEGRTVLGVEIAAGVRDRDGRPVMYVDGVHHAREWPASELTLLFAYHLVESFGKDDEVTRLLRKTRVVVVPIVNVDGFDYSRGSVLSVTQPVRDYTSPTGWANGFEGYWRKNRRSLTGVTVPAAQRNPDSYGVDPNRNYAYLWGDQQGGSSGSRVDQTYRGAAPFSEPETRNVRDILLGENVVAVITNHTYQGSVLRAGGGDAPEDGLLRSIGQEMADILGYRNAPTVGYPTTGTTDDYAYAGTGAIGYTIEHGTLGFHPAYDRGVGQPSDKTMEAFMVLLEVTADPRYHSVISGEVLVDGAPAAATLTLSKAFRTPLSDGNPLGKRFVTERQKMTMRATGAFEWHVGPSTRPWATEREAYTLTIEAGGHSVQRTVYVERGERLDLGTIRL